MTIVKPFTDSEFRSRSRFLESITNVRCSQGHPVSVDIRRSHYGLVAHGNCEANCAATIWRWQRDKVKA